MYLAQFKDYATNVKNIRPTENDGGWTKPKWKYWAKVHRQKRPKYVGKPQTHLTTENLFKKIQDLLVYSWGYSNAQQ